MFRLFKSKSPVMGMDISSTAVKVLQMSRKSDGYQVDNYAVVPIPPGVVVEKNIKDVESLARVIQQAVAKSGSKAKSVALALPDSSIINKVIPLDKRLSDEEMEMHIMLEADKFVPYPLDEVSLDFDVIRTSQNYPECVDVLVVASRAENVNLRVEALAEAGLDVKVVEVESYAVERACNLSSDDLPNKGQNELIAVVDIGSVMMSLTVLHNMSTVFSREEVFGGEQLTKAIQRHYGLSYAEAGLAKKQGNMPKDYITEVLNPYIDSAVLQIRRSLQFFYSASQHTNISHVLLAGGSVMIDGFAETIEKQIGIPVSLVNPFADVTFAGGLDKHAAMKDASAMMMCCGLAMRSIDG